jgi:hypothetical protein
LEIASVSRSHLSARHLLQQIEADRSKRTRRDIRPDWVTALIERVADLFDPVDEFGRVGFDCRLDEEGWSVALYLGAIELIGGKADGQLQCAAFRFDLKPLLDGFSSVDLIEWHVVDRGEGASDPGARSFLSVDGMVGENRVRLSVHSAAPEAAGPALRRLPDGRYETT